MNYWNRIISKIPWIWKARIKSIPYLGMSFYCNCCHSHLRCFKPGGKDTGVNMKYDMIGAGYHALDTCPACGASYRTRLVKAFLDKEINLKNTRKILHVAPEPVLGRILYNLPQAEYVAGDLEPQRYAYFFPTRFLDLLQIDFPDEYFDLIICNHVLEHIPDDKQAVNEIYRVMETNGLAILQVPYSRKLEKTYENSSIQSEEGRVAHFGQKDHVRVYGNDYFSLLQDAGFQVKRFSVSTLVPDNIAKNKLALDEKEQVVVGIKR